MLPELHIGDLAFFRHKSGRPDVEPLLQGYGRDGRAVAKVNYGLHPDHSDDHRRHGGGDGRAAVLYSADFSSVGDPALREEYLYENVTEHQKT